MGASVPVVSDVAAGAWSSTASDLHSAIDETVASDTDYIFTNDFGSATLGFGTLVDPANDTGWAVNYRIASDDGTRSFRIALLDGSNNVIQEETRLNVPTTPTTYTMSIAASAMAGVADPTVLRLLVELSQVIGGGFVRTDSSFTTGKTIKSLQSYGAVRDGLTANDAVMTSGSAVLTSASANFVSGDVGKTIAVQGAGASTNTGPSRVLLTTIASWQSATKVTLATPASAAVSGAIYAYGTDNTTTINNAFAGIAGNNNWLLHCEGVNDNKYYLFSGRLVSLPGATTRTGVGIYGDGPSLTQFMSLVDAGGATVASPAIQTQWGIQKWVGTASDPVFIRDLAIHHPFYTARASSAQSGNGYTFNIGGCTNLLIHNVHTHSGGSWIFSSNGGPNTGVTLQYCTVFEPYADGYHFEGDGQSDVLVQYCRAVDTEDDGIAFIGHYTYTKKQTGAVAKYNSIENWNSTHGGGIHADGWDQVDILNNSIYGTSGAGIRLSCSSAFTGASVDTVLIDSNYLESCVNSTATDPGQAPIYCDISQSGQTITNVTIQNNKVVGSEASTAAIRFKGLSPTENIVAVVNDNELSETTGTLTKGIEQVNAYSTITKSGNTFNGLAA